MVNNNLVIWLWLTVRHGFSMAHRNRWFTELNNGDFPVRYGTNNQMVYIYIYTVLVGGAITILKNMKVNGKDYISYIIEKMFQTTNQMT